MLKNTETKTESGWTAIPEQELAAWNQRLLQTDGGFFQYPYWNQPFRTMYFRNRFLAYRDGDQIVAYVAILSLGLPNMRIGLVQRGPVSLVPNQEIPRAAFEELYRWASRQGYVFLRFTHSDPMFLSRMATIGEAERIESFPFYRDQHDELIVEQLADDAQMLARFQSTARRKIKKAAEAGFDIQWSDSVESFRRIWPLFAKLAGRKGFRYRPLASYLELIRLARAHQCVRLYVASMENRPVEAILIVMDRTTASYMSGALDVEALEDKPSPSCLIHWQAMRDCFRAGRTYYHLGTRSGQVYQFKRQFRPMERDMPPPLTLITNPTLYRVWSSTVLRLGPALWPRIKRLVFQ